jgi:hypothetical protein
MAAIVYSLCAILSIACAALLIRGYRRARTRLLMWSALCFVGLAINNILLFVDKVMLPTTIDLSILRTASALVALLVLLIGLVWDTD